MGRPAAEAQIATSRMGADLKHRTADEERRSAIHWLIAGAIVLTAILGMRWLVQETNEEGTHDAERGSRPAGPAARSGAVQALRSTLGS